TPHPSSLTPRPSPLTPMRIALFGGSFDPVHNGHLAVAEACLAAERVDRVWFVPAAVQPHKPRGPRATDTQRTAMLRLAVAGRHACEVSTVEIDRGGASYTADTLEQLHAAHPAHEWRLLMGADTLRDLPNWRRPGAILCMAAPLVVHRPGEPAPDFSPLAPLVAALGSGAAIPNADTSADPNAAYAIVDMPPHDISSSQVRRRVAAGESIAGLVPPAVERYIREHGVYR
ncbi:MAG: nicotinate (nicotinamide) nucleotide adenylyltransferase, partial [Planctomycetota bacterium]